MQIGLGLIPKRKNSIAELVKLVYSLGGSIWLPNQSNFENTSIVTGVDDPAEVDDPIAYAGDLTTYQKPENWIKNSVFAGAVVGSPGTTPTGFTRTVNGSNNFSSEILEVGENYITLRVWTTAPTSGTTGFTLLRRNSTVETPAVGAELWSVTSQITFIGTPVLPASRLRLSVTEYDSGGTGLTSSSTIITGDKLWVASRIFNQAGVAKAGMQLQISTVTAGETYDFTIKISNFQLERGRHRTYAPTTTDAISRGNFKPAAQGTTANKPILRQTEGRLNWYYDGSNDYFLIPIAPTSTGYMFAVARQDEAIGGTNTIIGAYHTTVVEQAGVGLTINSSGYPQLGRIGPDGTNGNATGSVAIVAGTPFVIDGEWTTTSAAVRLNGANEATSAVTKDAANAGTAMLIGARNSGTNVALTVTDLFDGAIYAIGHIPSIPTADQKAQIRKLVAQLAGVPGVV